jgi:hypothetical protein
VIEKAPNEKDVEDLFKTAWAAKSQWAKKFTCALLYIFVLQNKEVTNARSI